jgi:hypothetical protein
MSLTQASLSGPDDRFRPIRHLQFRENIGDMISHGIRTKHEVLNDFCV